MRARPRPPSVSSADTSPARGGGAKVAVFLRAINVGGRRLLMEDFRRAVGDAGFGEARTVGAAGTAVVSARSVAGVEAAVEAVLRTETGQPVEVFAREGAQLAAVLAANPFHAMAAEHPNALAVVLLKGEAGAAEVDDLRRRIVGREEVAAGPGCLYVSYPDRMGQSKLTPAVIERALKRRGTARNWNTMRKMAELCG
jgi:uncharacterized protein (DUF1697 family)